MRNDIMLGIILGVALSVIIVIMMAAILQPEAGTFQCFHYANGGLICVRQ